MKRRATRAGACVRIDPKTGERTVIHSSLSRHPTAPYRGQYGLWDDLCQTWRGDSYSSIDALAEALYGESELQPMRWGGEFNPRPLTRAELQAVQKMTEEAG